MSDTTGSDDNVQFAIEPIEIQEEMEKSFLDYAMSVIVSRALPDVRDGLKPVHRRILWGMNELNANPDRPTMKSARITGEVMGKYHPHGDSAIYDALVRMAQDFSLRHRLIEPQGNFGYTPDDSPAAARYTECRLDPLALRMLADIDENTVNFIDNYSGEFSEPEVLPARFPNLLVNGSQGIAVGMATNIPPHNLGEIIDATLHLLANPDAATEDLMGFVKGPDFPTGGLIMGRSGIAEAYKTGKGSIKMRAKAEIVEGKTNDTIVVTELPYQVSPNSVFTKIKDLINAKELDGISGIDDFSAKGETRIEIKLKRDAPALVVLNNLFKRTPLQTSFPMNAVALVDGIPRTLDLRGMLAPYIDHQIDVITRRSQYRLDKLNARAHIVEGLIKALDLIDEIIALIRASDDRAAARTGLMGEPFEFSEIQANHILDMPLGRLTRLGRSELDKEMAELREAIAALEAILNDDTTLRTVIREELAEIREKEADPRRSELMHDPGEIDIEDLIDDEDLVFTMSAGGYVKTMSIDEFRTQGRGGRGVAGANLKDEDYVVNMIHTTAHAYLLFFSNRGKVYRLKAHQIPMTSRTARGTAIVNLLQLQPEEKIQAIIDTRDYETNRYLFFATKLGRVKKTQFTAYDSNLKAGLIAIKLNDGDELVDVIPLNEGQDVFLVSRNGQTIRFDESAVRAMGRTAAGVRGMKFREGDDLIACAREQADTTLLIITDEGYGKRSELDQYPTKGRGGLGVRGIRINEKKGKVVAAFMVGDGEQVFIIGDGGTIIRTAVDDISTQGRDATGVRVMNLDDGRQVAAVARVLASVEDDDELESEESGEAPIADPSESSEEE
ncbi:MAG: DNA gyrase subunit A [Acidimicrobiales bacterium]|nr:DNA gyrase subunit A [Acidimicrobiales bacterium]RZV48016.1 MAG: DNA gyrase subunit A [Acidimicrobiales bacterium]